MSCNQLSPNNTFGAVKSMRNPLNASRAGFSGGALNVQANTSFDKLLKATCPAIAAMAAI